MKFWEFQISKKRNSTKNFTCRLFFQLFIESFRKFTNQLIFLISIKISLQFRRLHNIIRNFLANFLRNRLILSNLPKYFQIGHFFNLIRTYFIKYFANICYIVSEHHATKTFNEYHDECLASVDGSYIAETNSEHNCGCPIVWPSILLVPWWIL